MANQCVILAGALGAESVSSATTAAEPTFEVGGVPLLETLFGEARRRGFDDFLLLAGEDGEALAAFLRERDIEKRFHCRTALSTGPGVAGTGGALVRALPQLRDEFLLLNGGSWFDFNWLDLIAKARRDGAVAALALRQSDSADGGATVELEGGRIRLIHAAGTGPQAGLASGGVSHFTRRAVQGFPASCSLDADMLPELAKRGELRGYRYSGSFVDARAPQSLAAAGDLGLRRRRQAVFLDRDGVLNLDHGYVHAPHQVEWVQGAKEAVKLLNDAGRYVFVVTNQAGVAKGLYQEEAIAALHRWMADELAAIGASIDDWRYCPFHPEGSIAAYRRAHPWRKPNPGMILDLFAHWPIEREGSFLVGDRVSDLQAAEAAGVDGYLFEGGNLLDFVRGLEQKSQEAATEGSA